MQGPQAHIVDPEGAGTIGVGIVGNGMATRVFHAPYIAATPGLELRAVVSRKIDALPPQDGVALVPDMPALLADPQIALVVIATPGATHGQFVREALMAGRHVLVEKPFTTDLAEAEALVELARERGLLLSVFHNRRWDSDFLSVGRVIAEGRIGEVVHFESHFDRFRPEVRDRWKEDGGPGSGIWYDLGPHLIDQALCLFGIPLSVSADIAVLRPGGKADDWAHVTLRYADKRVVLHAGMCVAGGTARFVVHGTRGSLVKQSLDPQEAQLVAGLRPGDDGWGHDPEPVEIHDGKGNVEKVPAETGAQQTLYARLADAISGRGELAISVDEILAVQIVLEAARQSSAQRRSVAIEV